MTLSGTGSVYMALVSVSFLWGTSFAAAKIGLQELAPLNLVITRFILASAAFGGILLVKGSHNTIDRSDIPQFILLGFLSITSYFYMQYTGLKYTTTINAALIIATSPIWAALIGTALGWERLPASGLIGIFTAFAGVGLIITNGQFGSLFQLAALTGDLMLLVNAVVWAGFTVYGRNILQKYRPFTAMAYIHIFGTLMLLPLALLPGLTPRPLWTELAAISPLTGASALYLALFCSVYAYHVWYTGVEKLGAVRTATFIYLNPLFAVITGILLLGESLKPLAVAGGLMIIAGVYLTNKIAVKRQQSIETKEQQCRSES